MSTSKTAKAKAAIDTAQDALQQAEDALAGKSREEIGAAADATIAAITGYDQPDGTDEQPGADAPIEAAADDAPSVPDAAPPPAAGDKPTGECVAFCVADALIRLGIGSKFASSHAIHRTMIGVMFHPDGTVSAGAFIEDRPENFDRHAGGMLAIANAGGARPAIPGHARKLFGG